MELAQYNKATLCPPQPPPQSVTPATRQELETRNARLEAENEALRTECAMWMWRYLNAVDKAELW